MKSCPGCQQQVADVFRECPFCRHALPFEAGSAGGAGAAAGAGAPQLDPQLIALALAADEARTPRVNAGLMQALLLFLALPVLVPSLIWFWFGAKRWGRVDWLLLAVTGFVLTLLTLRSPVLTGLMVVADVAAVALFVLRYPRLEEGIFLGYSNAVAMCLILGGLLTGGGALVAIPVGAALQLLDLYTSESALTAPQLASPEPLPAPRAVGLEPAGLDVAHAWFETPKGFQRRLPVGAEEVADAASLWERRGELAGRPVTLKGAPAAGETFHRERFETGEDNAKQLDVTPRVHGVVPGTKARVWLASAEVAAPGDAEAAALRTPGDRTGRLVIAYSDASMGRAWHALHPREPLPYQIVVLVPGTAGAAAAPAGPPPGAPAFVPVSGTDGRAWVHFPQGLPEPVPAALHGVAEPWSARFDMFRLHLRSQPGDAGREPHIISGLGRGDWARRSGLLARFEEGFHPGALACASFGLLVMLAGVLIATRE